MRPLPPAALLAALLLAPAAAAGGAALGPPEGWACIPEDPLCHPSQLLCPRFGMTAGWCARLAHGDEGAGAGATAGNDPSPRGGARAEGSWEQGDEGVERAALEARAGASWCAALPLPFPVLMMRPPWQDLLECDVEDGASVKLEP